MVLQRVGGDAVEWLDFAFDPRSPFLDSERKGLDFLSGDSPLHSAWRGFWPDRGEPPNWDAVARVRVAPSTDYLLVEAKGNLEEIGSDCQAREDGGRPRIRRAFQEVKRALGVAEDRDWLAGYYQLANRLTVLHFLNSRGLGARLLLVYFTGDRTPNRTCPATAEGWQEALRLQEQHIGLPPGHPLEDRIHKLFVPVCS
jgi:hypothetical protein